MTEGPKPMARRGDRWADFDRIPAEVVGRLPADLQALYRDLLQIRRASRAEGP